MEPSGEVFGISTIARDISERRRAEKILREQAELVDLAQDAIMTRDAAGRIRYWNRAAQERYGWRREEAVGRIARELLRTESPQGSGGIDAQLERAGRWEKELTHLTRDGAGSQWPAGGRCDETATGGPWKCSRSTTTSRR